MYWTVARLIVLICFIGAISTIFIGPFAFSEDEDRKVFSTVLGVVGVMMLTLAIFLFIFCAL